MECKGGTPGATRTHDTRFRKSLHGFSTEAIEFVPKSWGILAQFFTELGLNLLVNFKKIVEEIPK